MMEEEDAHIENFFGVYLLYCQNPKFKGRTYIGFTVDPNRRIKQHNTGVKAGGAYKTSNKGPWDMVLIVHGFPNEISALRFEWAWQNPHKSRRLRSIPKRKGKESKFDYCLRILANMLITRPWTRLPLTLRWLKQHYCKDFPPGLEPPIHMPIAFGNVQPLKVTSAKRNDNGEEKEEFCCLCKLKVNSSNVMRCLSKTCLMTAHAICIARYFLSDDQSSIIPVEGSCPRCNLTLLWGDLMRILLQVAIIMAFVGAVFSQSKRKYPTTGEEIESIQLITDEVVKDAKILGFYSVTTYLSLVTRTTSSIWTCMSTVGIAGRKKRGAAAPPTSQCTGRRRRRALVRTLQEDFNENGSQIQSSKMEASQLQPSSRTGRRLIVWSAIYSTVEIIITLPIPGSTVTVSALCNPIAGMPVPQGCFLG